jgi:hypothetical protein
MKEKDDNMQPAGRQSGNEKKIVLPGYPLYPEKEDIYSKGQKEEDINPEDVSQIKESNETDTGDLNNEKDFNDDETGRDLDIPGSELDDNQENVGSEDEENNYYSLGGEENNEQEEDKGE